MSYIISKDLSENYPVTEQNCDNEPIHMLGSIQSHGTLIGFSHNCELVYYSSNLEPYISTLSPQKNITLTQLFNKDITKLALEFLKSGIDYQLQSQQVFFKGKLNRLRFGKSNHQTFYVELEEIDVNESNHIQDHFSELESFLKLSEKIDNEKDLAVNAVNYLKKVTGFDKVMYYKFDDNGDGEIFAEEKNLGIESFLGLRYPATDIPKQARELYKTNLQRSIVDVDDLGVKLHGVDFDKPVDLSHSVYRTVSPLHIQYLKNMGVKATFAISIIHEGELWGMLICHNYKSKKTVNFNIKVLSSFFGGTISTCLKTIELNQNKKQWAKQKELYYHIKEDLGIESVTKLIFKNWSATKELLKLSGYNVYNPENNVIDGYEETIGRGQILSLIKKLKSKGIKSNGLKYLISSDKNTLEAPENSKVAGVITVEIPTTSEQSLYLFLNRCEEKTIYHWAGNPNDAKEGPLTPRTSFEIWQETVQGKCLPWTQSDTKVAVKFSRSIQENILTRHKLESEDINGETSKDQEYRKLKYDFYLLAEENKKKQEQLDLLKVKVNEAMRYNDLRQLVLSNLSHEIRTPISAIMGLSSIIQDSEGLDEENKSLTNLINVSCKRVIDTFSRLLEFDAEALRSDRMIKVRLDNLLHDCLDNVQALAVKQSKTVHWNLHNKNSEIVTDVVFLTQIITNLVNNGLKYSGENTYVEVNVKVIEEADRQLLKITVEDNGIGIEKEEQGKIFEPFYMSNEVTSGTDVSSGLGLYIVKSYVEYLGGSINIDSSLGKGTVFNVLLPVS
ncbi:ATP-binding protein [Wenyingzhuangia sp. IMCC45533]